MRIRNPVVSGFWLLMVTPCSCCVEAVLAGLMDVVCVLWSSRDAEIQAQENIRVQLELQAAKTSLLLFKVGGLPGVQDPFDFVLLKTDPDSLYRTKKYRRQ